MQTSHGSSTEIPELLQQEGGKRHQFDENQLLFASGDRCENYVYVCRGRIRVELLCTNAQHLLLYRIHGGEACVMTTACLLGGNDYTAQAVTESGTEIILLPMPAFRVLMDASAAFREFTFNGFSERLGAIVQRTNDLASTSIEQRLVTALLYFASQQRSHLLEVTHEQLALEIGTVREVVSRRLAALEKGGLIARQHRRIRLTDIDRLAALVD